MLLPRDVQLLAGAVRRESNNGSSATAAVMKYHHRLRNGFCCILLLLTFVCLQSTVHFNRGDPSLDEPLDGRRKRHVSSEQEPLYQAVTKEGPILDFGTLPPASLGDDVFIAVKTTLKFHSTRVTDIVDTWFRLAPQNIYFVTDAADEDLRRKTGDHVIVSNCAPTHSRQALCCKLAAEYDAYLRSNRSWFCHFDDDNYVNVPQLMRTLSQYDPRKDWYLGKSSTSRPIEIIDRENGVNEKVSFWFATGGAGFCLSKALAKKMAPYASGGKFEEVGERIRLPDDVTMGFIIEHMLKRRLQVVETFHSHLENMKAISSERLHEQVSLSAGSYNSKSKNVVNVGKNFFRETEDENRFKSLHCFLFSNASVCQRLMSK